jgi:hypothetical protein
MGAELFVAQIDGQTFLSQEEVDAYYEMLVRMQADE